MHNILTLQTTESCYHVIIINTFIQSDNQLFQNCKLEGDDYVFALCTARNSLCCRAHGPQSGKSQGNNN